MQVPLTIADHLERAALVYPDRIGVVDEPDQTAPSWGSLTYRRVAELARAQAAALDELGVGRGERVAIVSHNAARLLVSFFGVSAWGRVLVPVNFRLNAEEIGYIVEHSGATMLLVDPELDEALAGIDCKHRYVLGAEADAMLWPADAGDPQPWDEPDENATATINYTSGTTARPKGVEMTHRNLWVNAAVFGWQTGVNDRDVYLHTLPMFHCNGWGMPYALSGMGASQVVLRKVDGTEILRRVEQHEVTLLCGAPAVVAAILDGAARWDGEVPGRDRVRMVVAGAPPPTRTIERMETELGWEFIQLYGLTETSPVLTINRRRVEWDDLSPAERATRLGRAGAPTLGVRLETSEDGEVLARSNVVFDGYWNQPDATRRRPGGRLVPHRRRRHDRRRLRGQVPDHLRPQEGRDHLRRRERVVHRGRGRAALAPGGGRGGGDRRAGREVGRDGQGPGRARPRRRRRRGGADRPLPRNIWRTSSARRRWRSAPRCPARPPASSRSSSFAGRTGRGGSAR